MHGGRPNAAELVGFIMNKKFFTTPLWEKNKVKSASKENLESYECSIKFKFLPSDSFKILCLPKGNRYILGRFILSLKVFSW